MDSADGEIGVISVGCGTLWAQPTPHIAQDTTLPTDEVPTEDFRKSRLRVKQIVTGAELLSRAILLSTVGNVYSQILWTLVDLSDSSYRKRCDFAN